MELALTEPQRERTARFAKFAAVGILGLGVNLVVQAALTEALGINYVVAAILATQVSSTVNFVIADRWVFEDASVNPRLGRYLAFLAMNNAALVLRVPIMWVLTSVLGVHYTLSNLASLAVLTLVRFLLADGLIWRPATTGTTETTEKIAPTPMSVEVAELNELAELAAQVQLAALTDLVAQVEAVDGLVPAAPTETIDLRETVDTETIELLEPVEPVELSDLMDPAGLVLFRVGSTSAVPTPALHLVGSGASVDRFDGSAARQLDETDALPEPPDDPAVEVAVRRARPERWLLAGFVIVGTFLRLWQLGAVGLNSDEAVYSGQAAAIAGNQDLARFFPVFRAHPMLFQSLLSIAYHFGTSSIAGRVLAAAFGVGTIALAYSVAKLLYGTRTAVIAALIIALMPYQVIVDREVLLDAPTAFLATLTLYLLARYALDQRPGWLVASAGVAGLTVLSKETSIILLVAMFAFLALSPDIRIRFRDAVVSLVVFLVVVLPFPLIIILAGKSQTGTSYLSWQLFRRPNHTMGFYASTVPWFVGPLVIVLALAGLVIRWADHRWSWREWLLISWSAVPIMFFQLWPVKGFHYLLGAAVPVALLGAAGAADVIGLIQDRHWSDRRIAIAWSGVLIFIVALSLIVPAWTNTQAAPSRSLLAGAGGVPGGREAGTWIAANVPEGAQVVTIGPSMANLVQFYGRRKAYGLSVSPNAVDRNPSYEPLRNPDLAVRTSQVQYLVWDAYSGSRTSFFSNRLQSYVERYHGRAVYTYEAHGEPLITIYEVRP